MIGPADVLDLSSENGDISIDWPKVATQVRHVILRAVCWDKTGAMKVDRKLQQYADAAHHVGLTVSLYGFWRPREPPVPQAELLAKLTLDVGAEGAPWNDFEDSWADAQHTRHLDADTLADRLMVYLVTCDARVADLGQRTGIYTGPNFWTSSIGKHARDFRLRALWLAQYGAGPSVPFQWIDCIAHQHSGNTIVRTADGKEHWGADAVAVKGQPGAVVIAEAGHVDGVPGECDVSALRGSIDNLLAGRNPATAPDLTTTLGRQQALRLLGHDPGRLDGLWGSDSRAALVLVQRDLGGDVQADGVWGPVTARAIEARLGDVLTQ